MMKRFTCLFLSAVAAFLFPYGAQANMPTVFATLPAGNVAASLLDSNFTFLESQGVQGVASTGSPNAYIVTPNDAWTVGYSSYVGRALMVIPSFDNTGAATLNVSALGAASIYKNVSGVATALSSGDMISAIPAILICDGTGFLLANPTSAQITPGQIPGTTTNNDATAGNVGEYITATGSSVSISTNTPKSITSISLTAGDWDVSAEVSLNLAASSTSNFFEAAINTTNNTMPSPPNSGGFSTFVGTLATGANPAIALTVGPMRMSLATTTTVYAVVQASFAVSTATSSAFIRARRVR